MEKPKREWFKAHSYGHGWYPNSPEGWLVLIIWFLILIGSTLVLLLTGMHAPNIGKAILFGLWLLVVAADTIVVYVLVQQHGAKRRPGFNVRDLEDSWQKLINLKKNGKRN